nr:hypothetical protein CFP56_35202 [Quercus suber]
MDELDSNPNKCFEMFRMTRPYLLHLVDKLVSHGYLMEGQGGVDATQAVAMLLYILDHNIQIRCIVDRFQHLTKTVSDHFRRVLRALHSYARNLIKLDPDVVYLPEHLQVNKYWPSFEFIYVRAGWEGSVNDSQVLEEAIGDPKHGFLWPPTGSYYLVDSGLLIGTSFLPHHKSTRWLLNDRLGVLKAHFPILNLMPNFKRNRQRYVITACCCLHNFIRINNRSDALFNIWDNVEYEGNPVVLPSNGNNGASTSTANQRHVVEMLEASKRWMAHFRDDITDAMWVDYVARRH